MKIVFYCQHVLGMGHFFRSLEICNALSEHDVIFVTGGKSPDIRLAPHIREVRLPQLMMDPDFSSLHTAESHLSLEQVKEERKNILLDLLESEKPKVFMVELYPFGRKAFGFELDPVLQNIRTAHKNPCLSVCSLRDILVEKNDPGKYEKRVLKILDSHFDALLVHSDPGVFLLNETFSRIDEIQIPVVYTGFVTSKPPDGARENIRTQLNIGSDETLVVTSAGGGKVGFSLLKATLEAAGMLAKDFPLHIEVFSGPFMDKDDFESLKRYEKKHFSISRFTPDFLSYLAAADLSVSMAGYNTCMNILAANTPAIVWPFSQNREQRFRAERLAQKASFTVLKDEDLVPDYLAEVIRKRLLHKARSTAMINLEGGFFTARWLTNRVN